jgi:hypothetical protein
MVGELRGGDAVELLDAGGHHRDLAGWDHFR